MVGNPALSLLRLWGTCNRTGAQRSEDGEASNEQEQQEKGTQGRRHYEISPCQAEEDEKALPEHTSVGGQERARLL